MKVTSYEGVVENGCVHLPAGVLLPEKAKVYVVVPEMEAEQTARIWSPRLVDQSQAALFKLEVTEEEKDA